MPKKKKKEEEETESEALDVAAKDKKEDKKEEEKKKKEEEKKKKEEEKKKKEEKVIRKRIEVDTWKTDLHGKEIGIRQKEQQQAKSRQFSKDMDIFGSIKIGGEEAGHIGIRENEWTEDPTKGHLKRLVVRYFTEKDRWVASIEQDTIRGLMLSTAYGRSVPVFNVFHQGSKNVFTLQRVARGSGNMDRAVLPLILDKEDTTIDFFMIDEKRWTMGSDWRVYHPNAKDIDIAEFDSKKFNIGGKVVIDIFDAELAKNKIFVNSLILFGAIIKFWDEVNDHLEDIYKKYVKDEIDFKPNRHELEMLRNPRALGR